MDTNKRFWDISALVPLCVRQDTSQAFRKLWRESNRVIVWWGTPIEIWSALSRLQRNNKIDAKGMQFALTNLRFESVRCVSISGSLAMA
jgi:predicted nucleic acid-binding protein